METTFFFFGFSFTRANSMHFRSFTSHLPTCHLTSHSFNLLPICALRKQHQQLNKLLEYHRLFQLFILPGQSFVLLYLYVTWLTHPIIVQGSWKMCTTLMSRILLRRKNTSETCTDCKDRLTWFHLLNCHVMAQIYHFLSITTK